MIFIGDIHNDIRWLSKIDYSQSYYLLGDNGIGFGLENIQLPNNIKLIRGNHDDPKLCKVHPNYLGDIGVIDNIGFISGAYSYYRQPPNIVFDNEELDYQTMSNGFEVIKSSNPRIIISHDAPDSIRLKMGVRESNKTAAFLEQLKQECKPEFWLFGHHHRFFRCLDDETTFIGLGIAQQWKIN
jgi:predicted phosphodiesterase